jgi:DNA helicase II / ATP-dependent DNA helicase PcrA
VTIAPAVLKEFPTLNDAQRSIIGHIEGPLLVIAGPGSGKTFSLVLRALNLLLLGKVTPRELIICTFTEKAAFELRDRISAAAGKLGYKGDLSELRVTTIHGLCNRFIMEYRHRTPLGSNYETLDELTQALFVFDHFDEIVGPPEDGQYLTKWSTRWSAIEETCGYFNKITEELVDPERLLTDKQPFIRRIAEAYINYRETLFLRNRLDFVHQQRLLYDLLQEPEIGGEVTKGVGYVLVDEYQDTNFIQEQILLKLIGPARNICVVGDEDQSLYRFRGATVRNILEFTAQAPGVTVAKLTTNYRSHRRIIEAYDRWMASADWSNTKGLPFRYDKTIVADPEGNYPDYPAVFSIWGKDSRDEGERFADMIAFLKESKVITDYNQVALLLHSVRTDHSGHYLRALAAQGIPYFCPRARAYFENEEVCLAVACLAIIFGYYGEGRGELKGDSLQNLAAYVDDSMIALARQCAAPHPLALALQEFSRAVLGLKSGESLDLRPADYLYRLLAFEPFITFVRDENKARNLATLSQLLNTFQNYYHYTIVTHKNREYMRYHLFNSFFRLLYDGGINEYEDKDRPFPKGHVQVMTIHQSKGLEFSVIAVGSLDKQLSSPKGIDRDLSPYYSRPPFEPENRITGFDRMRLHYVAFSRPEKLLVLTTHTKPKDYFAPIWQGLPQWPYVKKDVLSAQRFQPKERMPLKRTYSFTGDLKIYETCPRQYQFFREYDFTPSRSAVIFFGLLAHQTIEEVHRVVLDGKLVTLNQARIRDLFEKTFFFLSLSDVRPVGEATKKTAFSHAMNYFRQNQEEMKRVIETEVDVSVEKDGYILMGKVDLLMGTDNKLELLDFKTSPKPAVSKNLLWDYERQLCTYAHIIERRYSKRPERLLVYWTSEEKKKDALMEFPYRPQLVEEAGRHFDEVVGKIEAKDFRVAKRPEAGICKECDVRYYCYKEEAKYVQ